jgi:hypothetical protein
MFLEQIDEDFSKIMRNFAPPLWRKKRSFDKHT